MLWDQSTACDGCDGNGNGTATTWWNEISAWRVMAADIEVKSSWKCTLCQVGIVSTHFENRTFSTTEAAAIPIIPLANDTTHKSAQNDKAEQYRTLGAHLKTNPLPVRTQSQANSPGCNSTLMYIRRCQRFSGGSQLPGQAWAITLQTTSKRTEIDMGIQHRTHRHGHALQALAA